MITVSSSPPISSVVDLSCIWPQLIHEPVIIFAVHARPSSTTSGAWVKGARQSPSSTSVPVPAALSSSLCCCRCSCCCCCCCRFEASLLLPLSSTGTQVVSLVRGYQPQTSHLVCRIGRADLSRHTRPAPPQPADHSETHCYRRLHGDCSTEDA